MQRQRCADLPVGTYNAQAVILGDKVYVGGGTLKFRTESPPYIYVYDTTKDMWQLLASPCNNGALAVYCDQLVVAGGTLSRVATSKVWPQYAVMPLPLALMSTSLYWEVFVKE